MERMTNRPTAWNKERRMLTPEERDEMVVRGRLQMQLASPLVDIFGRYKTIMGSVISSADIKIWMETSKSDHDQIHAEVYRKAKAALTDGKTVNDREVFEEELRILRLASLVK